MKRYKTMAIVALSVLVTVGVVRLVAFTLPVKLEGNAWSSIEGCAENQKKLYQSLDHHLHEYGRLPASADDFRINGFPAAGVWICPACKRGYVVRVENYGDPGAVVISDEQNRHPTTFMWRARGLNPHVQTMGDGTIHLFKGGKVLTMAGGNPTRSSSVENVTP